MNSLKIFKNENFGQVRTSLVDNEPMFCLVDVCRVLEAKNPTMVANRLDKDERTKLDLGRQGEAWFINESGLYTTILRSDKPQAKSFRKWVTNEVLPSIRKTGQYQVPTSTTELFKLALGSIEETNAKIEAVNTDLQDFKMDMPILGIECEKITSAVRKKGTECLGGKKSKAYQCKSLRSKVYSDIYGQLKREFAVNTYRAIKRNQSDLAVEVVGNYKIPFVLSEEIESINGQMCI